MGYELKPLDQGAENFPKVWNVHFSQGSDVFVGPFDNRGQRHRCLFEKRLLGAKLTVYFHVEADEDLELHDVKIYLYGAYNQVNVVQIRSHGSIRFMSKVEEHEFIQMITARLNGGDVGDKLTMKPTAEEKREALNALTSGGKFYCFQPSEYAFSTYERG